MKCLFRCFISVVPGNRIRSCVYFRRHGNEQQTSNVNASQWIMRCAVELIYTEDSNYLCKAREWKNAKAIVKAPERKRKARKKKMRNKNFLQKHYLKWCRLNGKIILLLFCFCLPPRVVFLRARVKNDLENLWYREVHNVYAAQACVISVSGPRIHQKRKRKTGWVRWWNLIWLTRAAFKTKSRWQCFGAMRHDVTCGFNSRTCGISQANNETLLSDSFITRDKLNILVLQLPFS